MVILDHVALQSLIQRLQSSSLEFNQQFEGDTNEEATADVKQCYALFMKLGNYLNDKINIEIRKIKNKENESQNINLDCTNTQGGPEIIPEKGSMCNTKLEKEDTNEKEEHLDHKLKTEKGSQDTSKSNHNQYNRQGIEYPCKVCKFVSPNYIVLRGHMKLEHDKEEKKICIKCGFESADLKVFKKHLKIVHAKKIKITQYRKM